VLGGDAVDEHVCLWSDDRRVDEAEEEETTDEGADGEICYIGVLALYADR
jgi:hypothetical protein